MSAPAESSNPSPADRRFRFRRAAVILITGVLLLLVSVFLIVRSVTSESPDAGNLLRQAERAAELGDLAKAAKLAQQAAIDPSLRPSALLLAARSLAAAEDFQPALQLLDQLSRSVDGLTAAQLVEVASLSSDILLYRLKQPAAAHQRLRQAAAVAPESEEIRVRLKLLYGLTGQWWRQVPLVIQELQDQQLQPMDLVVLALGDTALMNPEFAQQMLQTSPDDELAQLAAARLAVEEERHEDAIRLLTSAVAKHPDLIQAQVLLGREYFYLSQWPSFSRWLQRLPQSADDHPGIWVLRGRWALQQNQPQMALRCFGTAVGLDPNDADSLYQAGRLLSDDQPAAAARFLQRAEQLQAFVNAVKAADASKEQSDLVRVATLAEQLGNFVEADAWSSVAATLNANGRPSEAGPDGQLSESAEAASGRTVASYNPAATIDLDGLPDFAIQPLKKVNIAAAKSTPADSAIRFRNVAAEVGIPFRYDNGSKDVSAGTKKMYEVMGGGVAVLDFDADNAPDLYFTQGGAWDRRGTVAAPLDRLYRHDARDSYVDVTYVCGIAEREFGQGVAAGDVNSDGFVDLLVANIGPNRLFLNNGDGTFQESRSFATESFSEWSTSCAIADLTGDQDPEVFVANYLQGDDVFTRMCGPNNDQVCLPQQFDAAANRLYFNAGDGQLPDRTEASGIAAKPGKSLGVVVGQFGDQNALSIFVANDTQPNSFFRSLPKDGGDRLQFEDAAMTAGLALSDEGAVQACMGIAAGDADADGRTDLFVTNFHGESNTLYQTMGGGLFRDVALQKRLRQPSLSQLGFGTQFLDADLDGRNDLVVANGHIDDYTDDGRTRYQMQPQFFRNLGSDGFQELPARQLGSHFTTPALGRSLARLDWNADGRPDFVMTHLDAPVALLQNLTEPVGEYLSLRLIGVQSSRDAISTTVTMKTDSGTVTQQLTAGDGFQAVNQRVLIFGVEDARLIRSLKIRWSSGQVDRFDDVPVNSHWLAREGSERLFSSP